MTSFQRVGAKDPGATVPYQFDWSSYFASIEDTIDSAVVEVMNDAGTAVDPSSDLVISAPSLTPEGVVTVLVSGGTHGKEYTVRCHVQGTNSSPDHTSDNKRIVIPVRYT